MFFQAFIIIVVWKKLKPTNYIQLFISKLVTLEVFLVDFQVQAFLSDPVGYNYSNTFSEMHL